ncbi:hybrid sensor histidine kinase/response regulator [Erythrobacter mangrovi]|uniref:histidine kinase n=1 Tax=Erythrobacter mangrovi TaxID=2739433 RepID=A0A7D4C6I5_9SPHN|nr:PAS domain-containing sensor histidine kinase [Erythrobacter mangrovi]QKG72425.1 PAS domain S-box protein [Erythrobacter mangrovi]
MPMRNALLEAVLATISQGIVVTDEHSRIQFCNDAFCTITGYSREELIGQPCRILQGPETLEETRAAINKALEERREFSGEILNYRKNGETFWNDMVITPFENAGRGLKWFLGVVRDVTERKATEERLNYLRAEFQLIFDEVQAGLVLHDTSTTIIRANPRAKELLGLDRDAEGMDASNPYWDFVDSKGEKVPQERFPAMTVLKTGQPIKNLTLGHRDETGKVRRWLLCNASPVFHKDGEMDGVLTNFVDITHIREAEEEAKQSRDRLELATSAGKIAIIDWDLETETAWTNDQFAHLFGVSLTEDLDRDRMIRVLSKTWEGENLVARVLALLEGKETTFKQTFTYRRPCGEYAVARAHATVFRDQNGKAIRLAAALYDVSDVIDADTKLRESEERFRTVANLSNDVVWEWDILENYVWRSDGWEKLLELDEKDPPGLTSWEMRLHPEDKERAKAHLLEVLASDKSEWSTGYRMLTSSGAVRIIEERAVLIRDVTGKPARAFGSISDVTERTEVEARLRRAESLETTGRLTGGIAHDFNNMLMVILGNAEILRELELDADAQEMVELITMAAESGARLTKQLLTFSRQQTFSARAIDVGNSLQEIGKLIRRTIPANIEVHIEPSENLWWAYADQTQLENAILNAAVNARDAMEDGGTLRIAARNTFISASSKSHPHDLQDGAYVELVLEDDGHGMTPAEVGRAFEPFFTTKPVGVGTGLGLSMIYGFAKQTGGTATIESRLGEGTTIHIFLPKAENTPTESVDDDQADVPKKESLSLLLVEDDVNVSRHLVRQIRRWGLEVEAAADGASAMQKLQDKKDFDILLTDIVMPGQLSGLDLAESARASHPDMKIIFMSGYAGDSVKHKALERSENFLQKPFSNARLKEVLLEGVVGKANSE